MCLKALPVVMQLHIHHSSAPTALASCLMLNKYPGLKYFSCLLTPRQSRAEWQTLKENNFYNHFAKIRKLGNYLVGKKKKKK